MGHEGSEERRQAELRRRLLIAAKYVGLEPRDIDHLVESAHIVRCVDQEPICSSLAQDGMVNFMIGGVAGVYMHLRATNDRPEIVSILKLIAPGEFFCLASPPRDESYFLRALPYPKADRQSEAFVALWARAALHKLISSMRPTGTFLLLETSWKMLSRVGEEKTVLMSMTLPQRLRYVIPRLAHRFGKPHELGTLVDLWLPDDRLGTLVSAQRSSVNKAMADLPELVRVGKGSVVVRSPSAR